MIKIIKPGTRKKKECVECGCVFSYENEDLKWDADRIQYYVLCPQCAAAPTVKATEIKEWQPEPLSPAEKDEMKTLLANRLAISEGSRASQRLQELMWRDSKAQEVRNEADSD